MPANYAHYCFGQACLPLLPETARRTVRRFRGLYEAGLHGPDPFFYYNPVFPTPAGKLGKTYHKMTGRAFFEAAASRKPSEGATAYLYGVLTHYCLDAACHPLVNGWTAEKKAGHTEIETELDRHLLVRNKKVPAYCYNIASRLRLSRGETETIAWAYPPATVAQIRRSFRRMKLVCALMTSRNRPVRWLMSKIVKLAGSKGSGMIMPALPNPRCSWAVPPLMRRYHGALQAFPDMAQQLQDFLTQKIPLSADFDEVFG